METYVCRDWQPRNEYTTPIIGAPFYRNSGIIKAVAETGDKIQVGRIDYESFDNEEFQYIISPFWEIIDTLSASVFQGIPGIDMDLRLEHYYRVNYVPVFMTERTPGPNREDLWELLDSVGLDYYDRLEWLIRTDLRAAVDNLIVERARDEVWEFHVSSRADLKNSLENCQYGDVVTVDSLRMVGRNSKECTRMLNRLMHYGVRLICMQEGLDLRIEDYKAFLPVFAAMYLMDETNRKAVQKEGIEKAKAQGVYVGRKRKQVDRELLKDVILRFQKGNMILEEALEITGLSKSTFYRRIREEQKQREAVDQ